MYGFEIISQPECGGWLSQYSEIIFMWRMLRLKLCHFLFLFPFLFLWLAPPNGGSVSHDLKLNKMNINNIISVIK